MVNLLQSIRLEQYIDIFEEEGISLETFQDWEDDDLAALGLKKPHIRGLRRKIQESIEISSIAIDSSESLEEEKTLPIVRAKDSKKKVFFSYGHDRHTHLIQSIRDDLQQNGFDIWMDDHGLKTKDHWSYEIESAIENSTEVIYFITPHSARRPDGYCLKELRYALDSGKEITPIMLDFYKLPIDINLLQWMDLQPLANSFNKSIYKKFIYEISEIINGSIVLDGSEKKVNFLQLLKPLDFSLDIKKHIGNFVGRKWLYQKVDSFIKGDDNIFWITAEAGFGKTAFSTYLMTEHPNTVGIHFCDYKSKNRKDSKNVLRTLMYQLTTQVQEYKIILEDSYLEKLKEISTMTSIDILQELLIQPLDKIIVSEKYFFIIDALDEASENGKNELVDLVQMFSQLPSWLKIIITSRPEEYFKRKLSKLSITHLNANSNENMEDIKIYIKYSFTQLAPNNVNKKNIELLLEKSEGNILYIKEVFAAIKSKQIKIEELGNLPKGMDGLYYNMFERYFNNLDIYKKEYLPLANILVAYKNGLSITLIMSILDINVLAYRKLKEAFYSVLEENDGMVTFYHKSLFDWLSDYDKSGVFAADIEEGHDQIYMYFIQRLDEDNVLNNLDYKELDIFTKSVKYLKKESTIFEKDLSSYLLLKNDDPDYIFSEDEKIDNLYNIYGPTAYDHVILELSRAKNNIKIASLNEVDISYYFSLLIKVSKISDSNLHEYIREHMSKGLYSLLNFLLSRDLKSLYLNRLSKFIDRIYEKIKFNVLRECRILFISTFIDFANEREIFIEKIFPRINQYARTRGIDIQYIVPGYGIAESFYLKQSFIIDHVKSIQETIENYETFSISLIGHRYGWIPLPYQVESRVFEAIIENQNMQNKSLLLEWYLLDSNTLPSSYTLKPREDQSIDISVWTPIENTLRECIMYHKENNPVGIKLLSSTNFEVENILKYQDLDSSLCILKDLHGNKKLEMQNYIDSDSSSIDFFRNECLNKFNQENILQFSINKDYIDDMKDYNAYEEYTLQQLKNKINNLASESILKSQLEEELSEQFKFMSLKLDNFFGRDKELEIILNYINNDSNQPFMLTGIAAIGKSSLMAKAVEQIEIALRKKVIYRFIGASANSSTEAILLSIFSELGIDISCNNEKESAEDFNNRVYMEFMNLSEEVVIFIDAIDKLNLLWLPFILPMNVKIILSLTVGEESSYQYENIQSKIDAQNILCLEKPDKREIKQILSTLLLNKSRRLTNSQFEYALSYIVKSTSPYLYLKIAFEEIKIWQSVNNNIYLPNTLEEMFKHYLKYLNDIGNSKIIINMVLGYIVASHNGLSEADIIALLHHDENVLQESNKSNDYASENTIPYSVINRLLLDLKPFLKETIVTGERLINIEQKIIYDIIFEETYIERKEYFHERLISYFFNK